LDIDLSKPILIQKSQSMPIAQNSILQVIAAGKVGLLAG